MRCIPFADVFDVLWNGGVCPDAVFVHQGNEFRLLEVVWRFCGLLVNFEVVDPEGLAL